MPHLCVLLLLLAAGLANAPAAEIFLRASQIGYRTRDTKLGVAFAKAPLPAAFTVAEADTGKARFTGSARPITGVRWGQFEHHAELDFTALRTPGRYVLRVGEAQSLPFTLGAAAYHELPDQLLEFMRQQRRGYNPWLDATRLTAARRTAPSPTASTSTPGAAGMTRRIC